MRQRLLGLFKSKDILIYDQEIQLFQHSFEVKTMYRTYLKLIPTLFDRRILIQAKLRELQWIFREARDETCPDTIEYQKQMGYHVLQKIKDREYPPFPQVYPNPLKRQGLQLHPFNRKLLTHFKI